MSHDTDRPTDEPVDDVEGNAIRGRLLRVGRAARPGRSADEQKHSDTPEPTDDVAGHLARDAESRDDVEGHLMRGRVIRVGRDAPVDRVPRESADDENPDDVAGHLSGALGAQKRDDHH